MEINNLEKIKGLLSFDKEGDLFYFAQLIKRRKDQSEAEKQLMRSDNTIVKCYYITSLDYLERKWNENISRKENGLIKVITGIRRCGKSYLLFKIYYDYLLSLGINKDNIIALSLDDDASSEYRDPKRLSQYIRD